MTRVVLAKDHTLTLPGLNGMTVRGGKIEVVGSIPTGKDVVKVCQALRPNIVILDLSEPGFDGLATTRQIKEFDPTIKVVFLSTYDKPSYVCDVMQAGANAYLYRSDSPTRVLDSICEALYQEEFMSSEVLTRFLHWVNKGGALPDGDHRRRVSPTHA